MRFLSVFLFVICYFLFLNPISSLSVADFGWSRPWKAPLSNKQCGSEVELLRIFLNRFDSSLPLSQCFDEAAQQVLQRFQQQFQSKYQLKADGKLDHCGKFLGTSLRRDLGWLDLREIYCQNGSRFLKFFELSFDI